MEYNTKKRHEYLQHRHHQSFSENQTPGKLRDAGTASFTIAVAIVTSASSNHL